MIGFQELAPAVIVSAFGFGMILAVLGSFKPFLSEKMEISEGRVGRWISATQLALIPFVIICVLLYLAGREVILAGKKNRVST